MINRRKLFGIFAGVVATPVLTMLPKPSLADEAIEILGRSWPEEFKFAQSAMYRIDFKDCYWFKAPHGPRK